MKAFDTEKMPSDNDGDEGVTVSEEFQKQAHSLVHKASKHELSHLRDKVNSREDTMRQAEMSKMKKGSKVSYPETMSAM